MSGRGKGKGKEKVSPKKAVVESPAPKGRVSPKLSPRKGAVITLNFNDDRSLAIDRELLINSSRIVKDLAEDFPDIEDQPLPKDLVQPVLLRRLLEGRVTPQEAKAELEALTWTDVLQLLDILDFLAANEPLSIVAEHGAHRIEKMSEETPDDEALMKMIGRPIDTTKAEQVEFRKKFFEFDTKEEVKVSPKRSPRKQ